MIITLPCSDPALRIPHATPLSPFRVQAAYASRIAHRQYHAFVDFDDPEPIEEFDDDDIEDEDEERNALTDDLGSK